MPYIEPLFLYVYLDTFVLQIPNEHQMFSTDGTLPQMLEAIGRA